MQRRQPKRTTRGPPKFLQKQFKAELPHRIIKATGQVIPTYRRRKKITKVKIETDLMGSAASSRSQIQDSEPKPQHKPDCAICLTDLSDSACISLQCKHVSQFCYSPLHFRPFTATASLNSCNLTLYKRVLFNLIISCVLFVKHKWNMKSLQRKWNIHYK
jgi:hypothetical protein